jgi:hypothetical protein
MHIGRRRRSCRFWSSAAKRTPFSRRIWAGLHCRALAGRGGGDSSRRPYADARRHWQAAAERIACLDRAAAQDLEARPVSSPYTVPVQPIGSYFLFRIVFQKEPADLAAIKLYVFADRDSGPLPIQQATHPYPPLAGKGRRLRLYWPQPGL